MIHVVVSGSVRIEVILIDAFTKVTVVGRVVVSIINSWFITDRDDVQRFDAACG